MSTEAGSARTPGTFDTLDDAKVNRFQLKIMFVSGMGFFTDAYDLFVIGIVSTLLKTQWHLGTGQLSLLNAGKLLPESSRATTPATQRPRFAGVSGANDACAPLWEPPLCDA